MTEHAIVTGSSGGIGAEVCRLLHKGGWSVTGFDIEPPERTDPWAHEPVDLGVPGLVTEAAEALPRSRGPVTAIVHCAAIQTLGAVGTVAAQDWHRTLRVNVLALDELTAVCREDLRANQGSIVAISSVHAVATTAGIAAYATSKAALNGWVRAAALDLAPDVRVNAIQPGAVRTRMLTSGLVRRPDDGTVDEALNLLGKSTPLGFVAEPEDIAQLVVGLLDPAVSRYMTGCVLNADGGALIRLSTE